MDVKTIGIPPCTGTPGQPPFVSFSANKKAGTISFSSSRPVKQLLSILSGLTEREVVQYFKRTLTGKKAGSKVNVIVSEEKKIVFVYICLNCGERYEDMIDHLRYWCSALPTELPSRLGADHVVSS